AGAVPVGLQPAQQVHLLGGLPLAQQLLQWLHRAGVQWGEAVQLEGAPDPVEQLLLDDLLRGQPLREAGEWSDSCHVGSYQPRLGAAARSSSRYGLRTRSRPMVVDGPWPGRTSV